MSSASVLSRSLVRAQGADSDLTDPFVLPHLAKSACLDRQEVQILSLMGANGRSDVLSVNGWQVSIKSRAFSAVATLNCAFVASCFNVKNAKAPETHSATSAVLAWMFEQTSFQKKSSIKLAIS